MNPFWSNFFEHLKDCGRNGTIFIATLGFLLGLLILSGIIGESRFHECIVPAMSIAGALSLAWFSVVIRKANLRRRERLERRPLSRDEMRVARSKLMKERSEKKS